MKKFVNAIIDALFTLVLIAAIVVVVNFGMHMYHANIVQIAAYQLDAQVNGGEVALWHALKDSVNDLLGMFMFLFG